jgi:hypothetical protein
LDFARPNAGSNIAARMAMIAMTTSSSIRVNAALQACRTLRWSRWGFTGSIPKEYESVFQL